MADLNSIKERIGSITDEVGELHPLLNELFGRNSDIHRFEYTHGPGEMGADFIVVRAHEILKRSEYIGVVAKVGKVKQDLTTINRQIEECLKVPRFVEGGRKEIRLSEVWVVATSTITNGAQKKIHADHQGSKIHFLDGSDLAGLVATWMPDYWAGLPVELTVFLNDQAAKARDEDSRRDLIQVAGSDPMYVDQDVVRVKIHPYAKKGGATREFEPASLPEELADHPVHLVEAGMGGGKSKLVRRLVQELAEPGRFSESPTLPLFTTYKQFLGDFDFSLEQFFADQVPESVQRHLPDDARVIFFLDGLDEKEEELEDLSEHLEDLVTQATERKNWQVVLTSRPIGSTDFDLRFRNSVARYAIRPLTMGKIANYLEAICSKLELTTRLIDDLRKSPIYSKLPQSPLAAVLLAQILRENPQDVPSTIPELYSKYMELALGRWDVAKGLQSQKEYDVARAVLMDLAEYMLDNDLDSIGRSEFDDRVSAYLSERNLNVDALEIADRLLRRSDVLVASRDGRLVSFKHRSFSEFLLASRWVDTGALSASRRAFEMYWANVFYFGCGLKRDAPELLRDLAALSPETTQHRWVKPMQIANLSLAGYATPYPVIQEAVRVAIREAAEMFCDIAEGRVESPFAELSRIHLLYMMQLVVRDHYGFEFLGSALEYSAICALDEPDREATPYELFLLAVAYADAGRDDSFDRLIDEFKGSLPLDVSLAVRHEAKRAPRGARSS